MHSSESKSIWPTKDTSNYKTVVIFIGIFLLYLSLRILAWKNTVLLEDTDSLSYLRSIKDFLAFDLEKIIDMDPDSTPFYPFWGALFTLPGWPVETGARLTSLFFSSILFLAILKIGKQIASPFEVILGLLIMTFSPVLISLSFGVLTEPSYIATVYLGLFFFWTQYKNPRLAWAALLGFLFALAFINRTEGILYIFVFPFFQGVYILCHRSENHSFKRFLAWTIIYLISFSSLAIPQIYRVSHKLGTLAINGRQVWSLYVNYPDGKSYSEKIFGLDFSEREINIGYIKQHPEVMDKFSAKPRITQYIRNITKEFQILYQRQLGILVGPLALIFFALGIIALYKSKNYFEVFLILAFIMFNLIGPLVHNVTMRHIIIIAPIMFLTCGLGIVFLSKQLLNDYQRFFLNKYILSCILFLILLAAWSYPVYQKFNPPKRNQEYSLTELREPIKIIKNIVANELHRPPIISAQRAYLAFYSRGEQVWLPYTDYEGLVTYCSLNNIDFLYLKHSRVQHYPFFNKFNDNKIVGDNFTLIYSGLDAYGQRISLFRFRKNEILS